MVRLADMTAGQSSDHRALSVPGLQPIVCITYCLGSEPCAVVCQLCTPLVAVTPGFSGHPSSENDSPER